MKELIGKEVTIKMEVTETVSITGILLDSNEDGIIIQHQYRNGIRVEHVERAQLRGITYDVKKGPRRTGPIRPAQPYKSDSVISAHKQETVEDVDDFDSEEADFSALEPDEF